MNIWSALLVLASVALPCTLYAQTNEAALTSGRQSNLAAGVPEKDGKLDVESFTPQAWQMMTSRSAWELAGTSEQFALWYSYELVKKIDGYGTYVAIKTATKDKQGNYDQLAYFWGEIDCSQPNAHPTTFSHSMGAIYSPTTGYPIHIDQRPYDLSVASKPLLVHVATHVCGLVQATIARKSSH